MVGASSGWGRRVLADALPPEIAGTAAALVLGEGSAMTQAEWDKYIRNGVVHALAISGQHLMILAVVLWWLLPARRTPAQRRRRRRFVLIGIRTAGGRTTAGAFAAVAVCAVAAP